MTKPKPKPHRKDPSYLDAVAWIAFNDDAGADDALDEEAVSHMITVILVADVFGYEPERVARDVVTYRNTFDKWVPLKDALKVFKRIWMKQSLGELK